MRASVLLGLLLVACRSSAKPDLTADASEASIDAAVASDVADAALAPDASPPLDASVAPTTTTPRKKAEPPVCAQARDARARHSPITAQLEAACRAGGGTIDLPATAPPPTTTAAPVPAAAAICAQARAAQARHSPIAPQLEAQCRAAGGTL